MGKYRKDLLIFVFDIKFPKVPLKYEFQMRGNILAHGM